MRSLLPTSMKLAALALLFLMGATATTRAQTGRLEMGQLDHLAAKATETVDINIDERLVQLTIKFLSGKDPDEVKIKELVSGLKGIYVKSFEFERDGEYTQADLESIRSQLRNTAWSKVVNITSRRQGSVEVYLMTDLNKIGGLALLAADPKELTIVNIIGPVDLEKLSALEGQFGIPVLEIEVPKAKQKN
ncbi:MAG: DUF4252 domain-containing protein [Pyrinomonadaceae bacterium]